MLVSPFYSIYIALVYKCSAHVVIGNMSDTKCIATCNQGAGPLSSSSTAFAAKQPFQCQTWNDFMAVYWFFENNIEWPSSCWIWKTYVKNGSRKGLHLCWVSDCNWCNIPSQLSKMVRWTWCRRSWGVNKLGVYKDSLLNQEAMYLMLDALIWRSIFSLLGCVSVQHSSLTGHVQCARRGSNICLYKIVHPLDDESYLLDSLQYVQTIMVYLTFLFFSLMKD